MEKNQPKKPFSLQRIAIRATRSIGSPESILLHTLFFIVIFSLSFFGWNFNDILLFLTTIVSLEAIYLAIFIQMTVNMNTRRLREVSRDVEEIQEDVEEIQEDVGEIQEDVEELQEDVEGITEDDGKGFSSETLPLN
ncbi:MAG: hypothetical protein AAB545_01985 [Patescibacteria group bacterium]